MGQIQLTECLDIRWHYINLSKRKDRRMQTLSEFLKIGVNPARFNALTGDDYDEKDTRFPNFNLDGHVGCALSHVALLEMASHESGVIGIVEDDVVFCSDFQKRLDYIEQFTEPWDIFFLNAAFHLCPTWHKRTIGRDFDYTDFRHIVRVYGLWCTHSYLVNCNSAPKILEQLGDKLPDAKAIDHAYILCEPFLDCFCFVPGATIQRKGWSDITEGISEYSGFIPLGPHVYADRMEDFDYENFVTMATNEYSPDPNHRAI